MRPPARTQAALDFMRHCALDHVIQLKKIGVKCGRIEWTLMDAFSATLIQPKKNEFPCATHVVPMGAL